MRTPTLQQAQRNNQTHRCSEVCLIAHTTPTSPKNGFTPAFLDNLKPRDKRIEYRDIRAPGLRLRLEPSGRKTFVWYYKEGPKTRVLTLGRYGTSNGSLSLKQARDALEKAKERHRDGQRPGLPTTAPKTVEELAEIFYEKRILPHRSRPDEVRRVLDKDILPSLGRRKPHTLTAPDIATVVDAVIERGATVHAGKVLATLKQLFKFAEARGFIERSPAYSLDPKDLGVVDTIRDRYLNTAELKAIWQAIDQAKRLSDQIRYALKILILTGVRTGELLKARWENVDLDKGEWFIPEETSKTVAWTVPLVPTVVRYFLELKDIAGNSPWVLASDKAKTGYLTDKALNRALTRLFELKHEVDGEEVPLLAIPHCRVHDFRRTLRTHLDDLKMVDPETGDLRSIEPHIAEKCLNHSLGRIERTYNKNTLLKQRRAALAAWADYVDLIVNDRKKVSVLKRQESANEHQ